MSVQEKKSYILQELRKNGCRITNQRQLLIDIILQRDLLSGNQERSDHRHGNCLPDGQNIRRNRADQEKESVPDPGGRGIGLNR